LGDYCTVILYFLVYDLSCQYQCKWLPWKLERLGIGRLVLANSVVWCSQISWYSFLRDSCKMFFCE